MQLCYRAVRNIVENFTKGGSICAIDLSKAFDKVNHHALYLKLMKRLIPNELLDILECWLSRCYIRVSNGMTHRRFCLLLISESDKALLCPRFFSQYIWTILLDLLF